MAVGNKLVGVVSFTDNERSGGNRLSVVKAFLREYEAKYNVRLPGCNGDVPPPIDPPIDPLPPPPAEPFRLGTVSVEDLAPGTTPYGRWKPVGGKHNLELGVARGARGKRGQPGASPDLDEIKRRLAALEGAEFTVIIQDRNGVEVRRRQVKAKGGVLPLKFGSFDAENN